MQTMKNHWRAMTLSGVAFAIVVSWSWYRVSEHHAFANQVAVPTPAPVELTQEQYSDIVTLLGDLNLDRDALIALNLNENQALAVLNTVRTWYASSAASLQTLQNDIHEKTDAVRAIKKAIAMGPFDPSHQEQLASARQDLDAAQQAYDSALAAMAPDVLPALSVSQHSTWAAIQSGYGQTMPLRMLDLNDTQRLALSKAWRRYRYSHAAAEGQESRAAAVASWQEALGSILTIQQQAIVEAYYSNYEIASENVSNAWTMELAVDLQQG